MTNQELKIAVKSQIDLIDMLIKAFQKHNLSDPITALQVTKKLLVDKKYELDLKM